MQALVIAVVALLSSYAAAIKNGTYSIVPTARKGVALDVQNNTLVLSLVGPGVPSPSWLFECSVQPGFGFFSGTETCSIKSSNTSLYISSQMGSLSFSTLASPWFALPNPINKNAFQLVFSGSAWSLDAFNQVTLVGSNDSTVQTWELQEQSVLGVNPIPPMTSGSGPYPRENQRFIIEALADPLHIYVLAYDDANAALVVEEPANGQTLPSTRHVWTFTPAITNSTPTATPFGTPWNIRPFLDPTKYIALKGNTIGIDTTPWPWTFRKDPTGAINNLRIDWSVFWTFNTTNRNITLAAENHTINQLWRLAEDNLPFPTPRAPTHGARRRRGLI